MEDDEGKEEGRGKGMGMRPLCVKYSMEGWGGTCDESGVELRVSYDVSCGALVGEDETVLLQRRDEHFRLLRVPRI